MNQGNNGSLHSGRESLFFNQNTEKTMAKKILVIDDSEINRASARETLKDSGLEVLVAATYDEGFRLMQEDKEIEVVLTDLLMPASGMHMGPEGEKYVGQEMPVGFALVMQAVISGAKFVGVVTDTNHHDHPASAMLDDFKGPYTRFTVESADIGRTVHRHKAVVVYMQVGGKFEKAGTTCAPCGGTGREITPRYSGPCPHCWETKHELGEGKDWAKVLKILQTDDFEVLKTLR
jgi:CheY-like chemotaxis protein